MSDDAMHPMHPKQPMQPVNADEVAAFWERCKRTKGLPDTQGYLEAFQFGDSWEMADALVELVVTGPKRATAGSVADYEADGDELPVVGAFSVACDGAGLPRAVIRTTEVRVGPLSSVDEAFAWDEGEGDRTRDDWLRSHTRFFTRSHARLGVEMHEHIPVVFERFEVVYAE